MKIDVGIYIFLGIIFIYSSCKYKESGLMIFFKLSLFIVLISHTFLYAEVTQTVENSLQSQQDRTIQTFPNTDIQENINRAKTIWKIFSPILLLGILLLISHYVLRKYNKKLKNQVQLNMEEIKERDELLLQKQRMADMGEMLSMIAHQWRQPLGAINSAILGINIKIESGQFNLDDPADQDKFIAYLKKKHNSITDYVQHLSTTTDDFRNFFNPNKNKEIHPLTFPIENALTLVEDSLHKNGIKTVKDLQADPEFNMYQNEIMQVILNLIKNSEHNFSNKYITDPKITIATFLRGKKLVISICDNGGGIPNDIVKKIFEPYFSTKSEKHGTGLGLYMAKIIIEDHHNGILEVKNINDGVCFEMIFNT